MRSCALPAAPRRAAIIRARALPSAWRSGPGRPLLLSHRSFSTSDASARPAVDHGRIEKLLQEGKTASAIELLDNDPARDPATLRLKAKTFRAGKRLGAALEIYDQLTLLEPKSVDVWLSRAECLLDLQRSVEAAETFEEALKADRRSGEAWTARAMLSSTPVEALVWLDQALKITPSHPDTLKCTAYTLRSVGRYLEAIERIDQVLMSNSTDVEALLLKGAAFESASQFEDAYNTFSYVLGVEPANEYAASRLAEIKGRMLIADEAKATLLEIEKEIETKPDDAVLWQRKATFLLGVLGRYDSDSFETAYDLSKESASFFCKGALVEMLNATGRFTEALKWLERVSQLEPNDPRHQLNFANTLYRLSRFDDAVPFFDAVLSKDKDNTIAKEGRDAAQKMHMRIKGLKAQIAALIGPAAKTLLREAAADAANASKNLPGNSKS